MWALNPVQGGSRWTILKNYNCTDSPLLCWLGERTIYLSILGDMIVGVFQILRYFPKRNNHISSRFGKNMFAERKCFLRKVLDFRRKRTMNKERELWRATTRSMCLRLVRLWTVSRCRLHPRSALTWPTATTATWPLAKPAPSAARWSKRIVPYEQWHSSGMIALQWVMFGLCDILQLL